MTASDGAAAPEVAALELRALTKSFGAQVALRAVALALRPGEVHALLGHNGSGKSTLIKVLAGFHAPDGHAEAKVFGAPLELGSAASAHAAGLRFTHQDLALVGDLDVVDNLALGERYEGRRWLSDARERRAAQAVLDRLGIDVDARRAVKDLTPAQRTMVAVARALRDGIESARVFVLDEVTAALPEHEVETIFGLVRRLRHQGGTVLYVTHRLQEVFAIADRVTVLRDGGRVATMDIAAVDYDGLVELIVGRPLEQLYPEPPAPRDDVVLSVRGLGGAVARDVSFDVHRGEIVGVAGITGSGREELPYLLFGARSWAGGEIVVDGAVHRRLSPPAAIAGGLALMPADRASESTTPAFSLRENVTLPRIPAGRGGWLRARAERREVAEWLRRLAVIPPDSEAPLAALSGGNQQKVVLARWFRCDPAVLILDEPTQGVDVGAKAAIYDALADGTRDGAAVVVASTDFEELAAICDRVLVMRNGRIAAQLRRDGLSADAIGEQVLALDRPTRIDTRQREELTRR